MKKSCLATLAVPVLFVTGASTPTSTLPGAPALPPAELVIAPDMVSDPSSSETALSLFLDFGGVSDQVSWSSRSGDNGNYVFSDVNFNDEIVISSLTLTGVEMRGDIPVLSGLDLQGIRIIGAEADEYMDLGRLAIADPGQTILDMLSYVRDGGDLGQAVDEGLFGPLESWDITMGGLLVEDFYFASASEDFDGSMALERMLIKDFSADVIGALVLDRFDITMAEGYLRLGRVDYRDLYHPYMEILRPEEQRLSDKEMLLRGMKYEGIMEDFHFDFEGMKFDWAGGYLTTRTEGDYLWQDVTWEPMTLEMPRGMPELAEYHEMMDMMGLERLSFEMGGKTGYNPETDHFLMEEFDLTMAGLAGFAMDIDMYGMAALYGTYLDDALMMRDELLGIAPAGTNDYYSEELTPAEEEAFANMTVNSMKLTYNELGLIDRLIAFGSASEGIPEEDLRLEAKSYGAMLVTLAETEKERVLARALNRGLSQLIDGTATSLTIGFYPDAPISAQTFEPMMVNPAAFDIDVLGIEISTQ